MVLVLYYTWNILLIIRFFLASFHFLVNLIEGTNIQAFMLLHYILFVPVFIQYSYIVESLSLYLLESLHVRVYKKTFIFVDFLENAWIYKKYIIASTAAYIHICRKKVHFYGWRIVMDDDYVIRKQNYFLFSFFSRAEKINPTIFIWWD